MQRKHTVDLSHLGLVKTLFSFILHNTPLDLIETTTRCYCVCGVTS